MEVTCPRSSKLVSGRFQINITALTLLSTMFFVIRDILSMLMLPAHGLDFLKLIFIEV